MISETQSALFVIGPQPRKQVQRTLIIHLPPRLLIQLKLLQVLRKVLNRRYGRIGKIRAEHDVAGLGQLQQRRQRDGVRREGGVKVEEASVFKDLFSRLTDTHGRVREDACGAVDEVGQGAAGVGEDDLAVGVGAQGVGDDEVDGCAAGFVRVVEHWLGEGWVDEMRVDGVGGVDEDDGVAAVELGPDRCQVCVAEVVVVGAVACKEGHAVCVEDVEDISNFIQAGFGVEQGGERAKEAVAFWVVVAELGEVVVQLPGEVGGFCGLFLDASAWGGDGEDGRLIADVLGEGFIGFDGP